MTTHTPRAPRPRQHSHVVMAYMVTACEVMAGIVPAYIVMAYKGIAYIVMAYIVMAYIVMAYVVMAYIVMAYVVMAYIVMAYIVMAYIVMVYMVMAHIVMVYIVMADCIHKLCLLGPTEIADPTATSNLAKTGHRCCCVATGCLHVAGCCTNGDPCVDCLTPSVSLI